MSASPADILIAGGGPAGATAAIFLARANLRVTLCEQKSFPRHKVCGEFMSTHIREPLRQLDLLDWFDHTAGPPVHRVHICNADGPTLTAPMSRAPDGHYPRAISRDALDEQLLARAAQAGATVLQPCKILAIDGSAATGFTARTDHGILHSRTVILAHGLAQRGDMRSTTTPPKTTGNYLCFKTHLAHVDLPDHAIAIAGAPGLYAGLVRTSDLHQPRFSLAFVITRDRLDRHGNSGESQLHALLRDNPQFARLLRHAQPLTPWLASGPLIPGIRTIYHDGRFFVGNAAGEVHALVGEGITLAMRSAALLARTLTQPHALTNLDHAGALYTTQWRREFRWRYLSSLAFANLLMRPSLTSIAASILDQFPPLLPHCVRITGKW